MQANTEPSTRPILFIILGLAGLLFVGLITLLVLLLMPRSPSAKPAVGAATLQATKVSVGPTATTAAVTFATDTPQVQSPPTEPPPTQPAAVSAPASPTATATLAPTKAPTLAPTATKPATYSAPPASQPSGGYRTAVPAKSGVYVTSISMNPAAPRNDDKPIFNVGFYNTTGSKQQYKWFIQIYRAVEKTRFGETQWAIQTVNPGSSVLRSVQGWGVVGAKGCWSFYAQAEYIDPANGARVAFTRTDGRVPQVAFTWCRDY